MADNLDAAKLAITKTPVWNEGTVLVNFRIVKKDMVCPMVPAGGSISDMLLERLSPKTMV